MIKRLPWLRNRKKTDPEVPVRLPIAVGPLSNGEGYWPDSARKRLIRKLVLEKAEEVSRKEGCDRREFLASACGMATSLYMINLVNGCSSGKRGGYGNGMMASGGGATGGKRGSTTGGGAGTKGGSGNNKMGSSAGNGGGSGGTGSGNGGNGNG